MKSYLKIANIVALFIASVIGAAVGSQEGLRLIPQEKYKYIIFLGMLFFIFYAAVEYWVLRKLRSEGCHTKFIIANNQHIKLFSLQIILLFSGGWLVFAKYELDSMFSYIVLSMLISFFVGSVFESLRLLRRSV